jgi:hypothetical protein
MALTLPITRQSLADLLPIETVAWSLGEDQELSGLGSGEGLAADLGPRLWSASCSTIAADIDTIEALRGRLNALDGAINSFYLFDPRRPFPSTDPTGALLGGATVTIQSIEANRKELTLSGVPAGLTLPGGTMLSVTAGAPSRTALLQLVSDVTADPDDDAGPVELRPHLRPWIAAGQTVTLIRPVAKVKLVPKSTSVDQVTSVTYRLRFAVQQTLAAG